MAGNFRITLLALVLVALCAAPATAAGMYSVETWESLPPDANVLESVPISWWEVAPLTLTWYMVCMICPLLCHPVDIFYVIGAWCSLGFRRVARRDVLGHPVRATVYDYIRMHPGTPFSVIAEQNGINRGTLHYHLYILLREGRISERREGGRTAYFENDGKYSTDEKRILSRIRGGTGGEICRHLARSRSATRSEIACRMGITPSSVSWHLSRLSSSGIIVSEKDGGTTTYRLTSGAAALLCACMPDSVRESRDETCM
ncbi:winged helix-turn-helix transcriptional regulator [Methanoculleus frigidifontis]|nr:helix-turn-helix domain-containing protein [Methanoculleus sp. FWC-SCC1]